jgi:hypothetical protein
VKEFAAIGWKTNHGGGQSTLRNRETAKGEIF